MVTMPRSADRSDGVRSCVRASMAMMVGTPIRKEIRYFSAYSRQRSRREIAQDDHLAARVQRRARAARVDAAAVEPRGHVHRAVEGPEREVHHHVVRGEHLVDTLLIGTPLGRLVVPEV